MTETNFTQGPWAVYGDWGIKDSSGRLIAQYEPLCSDIDLGNKDESFANANLIAAAPDLLESLTNLVGLAKLGAARLDKYHAALSDAEAAIAKARGES